MCPTRLPGGVVRIASDAPDRVADAVTGFPTAADGSDPFDQIGPRGLAFLDDYQLVVATATASGGAIRTYGIPADRRAQRADQPRQELKLPAGGGWAVTRTRANDAVPDLLVIAATATGPANRLLQCRVQADFLGELQPFGGPQGTAATATAVTVGDRGYVAVGRSDVGGAGGASTISLYNPADGATLLSLDTTLHQLVALAYSPATGNLYAADFAPTSGADAGGVYRIDDASQPGHPACHAVKVAAVHRPTALAFGPDGALYVTAFGDDGDDGTLVKIAGGL